MVRMIAVAAAVTAALSLAGCNNSGGRGAASGICKPFTAAATTTNALPAPGGDPGAAVDDCLHRWGYALAGASDPANVVAQATVAACGPSIATWNRASGGQQSVEAPSIVSGQPTNAMAEHLSFAMGRALLYVVQARAGNCAPPPAPSTSKS